MTHNKTINYPYAYGRLSASVDGVAFKAYMKAYDMGLTYAQANELREYIENYVNVMQDEVRERAAAEYAQFGA